MLGLLGDRDEVLVHLLGRVLVPGRLLHRRAAAEVEVAAGHRTTCRRARPPAPAAAPARRRAPPRARRSRRRCRSRPPPRRTTRRPSGRAEAGRTSGSAVPAWRRPCGNLEQVPVSCDSVRVLILIDVDGREHELRADDGYVDAADLAAATGWELKPVGPVPGRRLRPAPRPRHHAPGDATASTSRLGGRARPAAASDEDAGVVAVAPGGRDARPRGRGRQGAVADAPRRRRQPGRASRTSPATSGCWSPGRRGAAAGTSSAAGSGCRTSSPTPASSCSRSRSTPTPRTPGRGSRPPAPTYPVAVDTAHVTAERYGITNVPSRRLGRRGRPDREAADDRAGRRPVRGLHHDRQRAAPRPAARLGPRRRAARERRHRAAASAPTTEQLALAAAPGRRPPPARRPHRRGEAATWPGRRSSRRGTGPSAAAASR